MLDRECVEFLQWALPQLNRPWAGFRKVRRQLCRRIERRCRALALANVAAYRNYLEHHPDEWPRLDALCPITISCFYRDTAMWAALAAEVLPTLARSVGARDELVLRAASIGCASGEEPYTLMLAWQFAVAPQFPGMRFEVTATDVVDAVLERARIGCFADGNLRLLPPAWREHAFERVGERWCLRARYRDGVTFFRQDLRAALPLHTFDLILCRNLVFTYFDTPIQRMLLTRLLTRLAPGGALVIGRRERLPAGAAHLAPWPNAERQGIFRYAPSPAAATRYGATASATMREPEA
jgi:chemotaxis protein methyltransferase CheR